MQPAIIICFLAGLVTYTSAASTTDSCATQVQNCFTNLKRLEILDYFDNDDYTTGCNKWANALKCVNNAGSSCATAQTLINNITRDINALNRGCNDDGTVNACQKEIAQCLGTIFSAAALVSQPSVSVFGKAQACALTVHFADCLSTLESEPKCQGDELTKLEKGKENLATLRKESNCDTPCAAKVAECFKGIGKVIVMPSQLDSMCSNYKDAFQCVNRDANATCKDNPDQLEGLLDANTIQDYCNTDGTVSACQTIIKNCDSKVPESIFNTGSKMDRCDAFKKYLDCTQDDKLDACTVNFVQNKVNELRAKFLKQENLDDCPTIGDCDSQKEACEETFINALSLSKPDCQKAQTGVKCMCNLDSGKCNAPLNILLSKVDSSNLQYCAKQNINLQTCGGSALQFSLGVILVAILTSFFKKWL